MAYPEQCITNDPCPFVARLKQAGGGGFCPDCGNTGQVEADVLKPDQGRAGRKADQDKLDVRPLAEDPHGHSGRSGR